MKGCKHDLLIGEKDRVHNEVETFIDTVMKK